MLKGFVALTLLAAPALAASAAPSFEDELAGVVAQIAEEEPTLPPAELPDAVDLSEQFDPAIRSQGSMQTCHAFVATALLEAAHFRRTGERVRLSEADVFLRARTDRKIKRSGGMLRDDLWSALEEGAAIGDFYPAFEARWHAGARRAEELSPEAAAAPRQYFPGVAVEGPGFLRFFGSAVRTGVKNGAVRCAGRSKRRDLLMKTLAAGKPVGAGFLLDGMSDPDFADDGGKWGGPHYLTLTGYRRTPEGVVFTARNSWLRSPHPKVTESDLCSLYGLSWLTP